MKNHLKQEMMCFHQFSKMHFCVNQQLGISLKCANFSVFLHQNLAKPDKHLANGNFDQHLEYAATKRWSK